jgi:hypothetical protein
MSVREITLLSCLFEADDEAGSDRLEELLDLLLKGVAHSRQLLAESSQQATHVSLTAIDFLGHLEKAAHSVERDK